MEWDNDLNYSEIENDNKYRISLLRYIYIIPNFFVTSDKHLWKWKLRQVNVLTNNFKDYTNRFIWFKC